MKEFCPILNSLKTLRTGSELRVPQSWPLASSLASADSSRLLPLPAETLKWFKPVSLGLGKDILQNSQESWKRKSVDNCILPWSCMERRADAQFCSCFWVVVLCQESICACIHNTKLCCAFLSLKEGPDHPTSPSTPSCPSDATLLLMDEDLGVHSAYLLCSNPILKWAALEIHSLYLPLHQNRNARLLPSAM